MIMFWVCALALMILLYVLLDGFDLGVGILFGLTRHEEYRRKMLAAISPVWDGNETWLVLSCAVLFGAFSHVYAVLLSAFYLPLIFMIGALILRGVAFEFRYKTTRTRWIWDLGFAGGSFVAAFLQGATVGALVEGISMMDGRFTGQPLSWLTPFSCLCGFGLAFGYSLLGAAWIVNKCEGDIRARSYAQLPYLIAGVSLFLAVVFVYALEENLEIMNRWLERPILIVFPLIGAVASSWMIRGIMKQLDPVPFRMASLIFLSAFLTLAVSFWPYMIPYRITIEQAAGPLSSLNFMFWGAGLFVLPLTLIYTLVVYRIFSGKIVDSEKV